MRSDAAGGRLIGGAESGEELVFEMDHGSGLGYVFFYYSFCGLCGITIMCME